MKFGIVLDKTKKSSILNLNGKKLFVYFLVIGLALITFVVLSDLFFPKLNLLRHQHGADLLFDIVVVIFVIFLLRYNISFDAGFFGDGKEFVFRARRNSEYEDLKNQFYSVGLYKGDIRK